MPALMALDNSDHAELRYKHILCGRRSDIWHVPYKDAASELRLCVSFYLLFNHETALLTSLGNIDKDVQSTMPPLTSVDLVVTSAWLLHMTSRFVTPPCQ
jgi:hypothetical protein